MKKIAYRAIMSLILLLPCLGVLAQEKTDIMRDNGRMYVVVAVMVTILLGLIIYMTRLDRKIGRIEKELDKNPNK
jgi:hypothetical protein